MIIRAHRLKGGGCLRERREDKGKLIFRARIWGRVALAAVFAVFYLLGAVLHADGVVDVNVPSLSVPPHPNHYILLVDASGSTVSNAVQLARYRRFLTSELPNLLYRQGFGSAIPSFDPAQDMMTIMDFGIVPAGISQPYRALANYDLRRDYVHERIIRRKAISEAQFAEIIWPSRFYMMTILSWAKSLALSRLLQAPFTGECQRTFLLMIHDGLINGETIQEEAQLTERWADRGSLQRARKTMDEVNALYMFCNADRQERSAWSGTYDHVFLEAFEVWPRAWLPWESRILSIAPFRSIRLKWEKERAAEPIGTLRLESNPEFISVTGVDKPEAVVSIQSDHVTRKMESKLAQVTTVPYVSPTALTCQPADLGVLFQIALPQADRVLGRRTVLHQSEYLLRTPPLSSCTLAHILRLVVLIAAAFLLLSILIWIWIFSKIATPIRVIFPSQITPVRIRRKIKNGNNQLRSNVHPLIETLAFTILSPPGWIQRIFLRGAILRVDTADPIQWNGSNNHETKWPLSRGNQAEELIWTRVSPLPSEARLVFEQRGHRSEYIINFPQGIAEEEYDAQRQD